MVGGAAPQVLAHSATTRTFEITDEIEVKDDLDNKPDETTAVENVTSEAFSGFADAYAAFVLESYRDDLRFAEKMERECPNGCRLSYLTYFTTLSPTLETFFKVSDYTGNTSWVDDNLHREIEVEYSPSPSEFSRLQAAFSIDPKRPKRPLQLIIQSSTVRVEPKNNHLVIVTRLPRAGLDALLAKDAK